MIRCTKIFWSAVTCQNCYVENKSRTRACDLTKDLCFRLADHLCMFIALNQFKYSCVYSGRLANYSLLRQLFSSTQYSSLSWLPRQSVLILTELPEMVTVVDRFFQLEYSESYTYNMHGYARIEGYHYCMPLKTLLTLNYNSFILTVGIIGLDSHARDMYGNSHSQGTYVLLEIPSTHKLVQYFRSLYTCRNEDIYELKGVHIAQIYAPNASCLHNEM